jgi:hypothetical protein
MPESTLILNAAASCARSRAWRMKSPSERAGSECLVGIQRGGVLVRNLGALLSADLEAAVPTGSLDVHAP